MSLDKLDEHESLLCAEDQAELEQATPEFLAEVEAAWAVEIERRIAAYERGEMPTYPAEEVFAEARRILRERSTLRWRWGK